MNWKLTASLVVVAAFVGAFVYFNPFASPEERRPRSPWFYQLNFDDIIQIEVNSGSETERFSKNDKGAWVIDRLGDIPPSHMRWGGIVLLLSGPQTRRDISEIKSEFTEEERVQYGLDDPGLVVNIGLTGDRELEFRLGDKTTDGNHHYGEVVGFKQLYLIADSWGDVLTRLAVEPPTPKWWRRCGPRRDLASAMALRRSRNWSWPR